MPLPKLSEAQISAVTRLVAEYIARQRQTYRGRAVPLDSNQVAVMRPFFPPSTLDARVAVLEKERVGNPPFYVDLIRMGFQADSLPDFAAMAAITFVDTVVSHGPFTNRTLFHELVHVVQYEKLGLAEFAPLYVRGFLNGGSYEAIPLEMNAYELDAQFVAQPTKAYSVADAVQAWIDASRF